MAEKRKSDAVEEKSEPPIPRPLSGESVALISSSGTRFTIPREMAEISALVKSALSGNAEEQNADETDSDEEDDGDNAIEVSIRGVADPALNLVTQFMRVVYKTPYQTIEAPLEVTDWNKLVPNEELRKLLAITNSEMRDLLFAAEFMNIKSLINLVAARVALDVATKPLAQIKEEYGITVDYSEELKAATFEAHPWLADFQWGPK